MGLGWCPDANVALSDLTREGSGVDFVLFTVENPKSKAPQLIFSSNDENKGRGGRARVQQVLEGSAEDAIVLGCFLVSAIDQEEGSTAVSVRSKFIHVAWMGAKVGVLLRGKVTGWMAECRKKFPQAAFTVQLQGTDMDDLQEDSLESSLSSAGGAHKPKRYSFTNSTLMSRDAAANARAAEEAKRQAEEDAKRKAEEEAKRKVEEAKLKAAEAKRKAEEEARLKAEAEEAARLKAEEDSRIKAEADEAARLQAEEEARLKAEEEAKLKAEEEARLNAEEEARFKAEEEARLKAEEEARLKAEEEARIKAEEEARLKAIEDARLKAEEDARLKAEEEARLKAEEEARIKAAEEAKRKAEEDAKRKAEEEAERQRTKILITKNATLGEGRKLVLLISKLSGNFQQTSNTSRLKVIIDGLGLPVEEMEEVDGSVEKEKERRNTLFDLSEMRANYPQVFLQEADSTTKFVGDFDTIQYLNETGTLGQTLGITIKKTTTTQTISVKGEVEQVVDEQEVVENES